MLGNVKVNCVCKITNAMVTNKTDIVRFQRFAHHRRIWQSPGHQTISKNVLLCGHKSHWRRSTSVYDDIGRCQAGHRTMSHCTVPGRFYTDKTYFYVQLWLQNKSKFAVIPPKKEVVKIGRIQADSDSNGGEKSLNCNCLLHVIHPQLLNRNIYFCIYVFGLQNWNIYVHVYAICISAYKRCFSSVAVRLIKHRPVPRRFSKVLGFSDIVRFFLPPAGRRMGDVESWNRRRTVP